MKVRCNCLQQIQQLLRISRLKKMKVDASVGGSLPVLVSAKPCDSDNYRLLWEWHYPDPSSNVPAIQHRQSQAEQHYINPPRLDRRKCRRAVRCDLHTLMSAQMKQGRQRKCTIPIIFCD